MAGIPLPPPIPELVKLVKLVEIVALSFQGVPGRPVCPVLRLLGGCREGAPQGKRLGWSDSDRVTRME